MPVTHETPRKENIRARNPLPPPGEVEFSLAGRSNFLRVDLDAILHNVLTLQGRCSRHTQVIAVIKANAYGHGAVSVARHLSSRGISHFAVATAGEGQELRQAGVQGYIQVFGNCTEEEVSIMRQCQLTPTVGTPDFLRHWTVWPTTQTSPPPVVIKVDSGMSRNGCQPQELSDLMKLCEEERIPVHSLMTHFAQSWDDPEFTRQQLNVFLQAVKPFRSKGMKVHVANSAAILRGFGTDLDFVRPGICIYGLPPEPCQEAVEYVSKAGLWPALAWFAHPTLVHRLGPGRHVGYNQTYVLEKEETIATFALGYADGYRRLLSDKGVLVTIGGEEQHVVGRVSMDAITVRVKDDTTLTTPFYVYRDSHEGVNSVAHVARDLGTIPYEVVTSLVRRLPRLYLTNNLVFTADGKTAALPTGCLDFPTASHLTTSANHSLRGVPDDVDGGTEV